MIRFLTTTKFDTATATSLNNAGTAYVVANVQDRFLKKAYRSTGLTDQWLKFDLGSAKALTDFTFFYNNLTSAATVKLFGHASDMGNTVASWAAATFQQTITDFDTRAGLATFASTSLRWWFLGITDAANPDSYIQIGRVFAGESTSPTENFSENITINYMDPSDQTWSTGGHVYSVTRERAKEFSFQFVDVSTSNFDLIELVWLTSYKTEPLVIIFDKTDHPVDWTRYGVFSSDFDATYSANNRSNISLTFKELR